MFLLNIFFSGLFSPKCFWIRFLNFRPIGVFTAALKGGLYHVTCSLFFSGRPTFACFVFFLLVVEFALIATIFQGILVVYFAAVKFVFVTGDLG